MSTGNSSVAQQQIENPTHTQEYVCPRMDHELTKGGWAKIYQECDISRQISGILAINWILKYLQKDNYSTDQSSRQTNLIFLYFVFLFSYNLNYLHSVLSSDSQHFERLNNTLSDGAVWKYVQSRLEQNSPPPLVFFNLRFNKTSGPAFHTSHVCFTLERMAQMAMRPFQWGMRPMSVARQDQGGEALSQQVQDFPLHYRGVQFFGGEQPWVGYLLALAMA